MKDIKNVLLIVFGSLFVLLGVIGLLLPVVPTTPFLIVAGICYIKSSDNLYNRLIRTRYFGPQIKSYVEHRSLTKKTKIVSILLLWIPTLITVIFIANNIYVRMFSLSFVTIVTWHILSLNTIGEEDI